jgi:tetratricopeptide (TPR) repeat protein
MKRYSIRWMLFVCAFLALITAAGVVFGGQFKIGHTAPKFTLTDLNGEKLALADLMAHPMVILYFFDVESQPSQEGLLSLDRLAKKFPKESVQVWGITESSKPEVTRFVKQAQLMFPTLLDNKNVSDLYNARVVLPTVCILGPGLRVQEHIQGGGKSTEMMLVRLAETELRRKKFAIAKALSLEAEKKDPSNLEARMIRGYAALKGGDLQEAEMTFKDMAGRKGKGEVLGKEGLVGVAARKGQNEKALQLAKEVEKKAPDRPYVHVVKGNIYSSKNMRKEAEAEYRKAVQKKSGTRFQKAVAHNQLGRLNSSAGDYQSARKLFDRAVEIDPYYIEPTSNKGLTYEKEAKWNDALDAYRQVLAVDKNDVFAGILAKRVQERLSLQNNAEKKKRMDKLIQTLSERYRSYKNSKDVVEDTWTSRPMILTFMNFQEKGGLAERDGLSAVLTSQLTDKLNSSRRAQVVERILVEKLLEELNIGTSELADQDTALRIGRVLAAKLIGTGSLLYLPSGTLLSFRLIDTETSALPKVITRQISPGAGFEKEFDLLYREILEAITTKYPLRGYVVQTTGDKILLNLGRKQGVIKGIKFDVLEESEPITYKGKVLHGSAKPVAQIEVVQVEKDLCYAKALSGKTSISRDAKVQEKR